MNVSFHTACDFSIRRFSADRKTYGFDTLQALRRQGLNYLGATVKPKGRSTASRC
ncbi:hypothetical protein AM571_PC02070 (plasmid) [Rhizobium etli 8C-3]|uniref:Uncharacterized protein n=1 Tax=Rhizobium etli 8C-3 TaxID=538025 RepID=A0A1L5PIP3_RHIET|nr:hypothetical protein AM571_PC02070 [Rhizobium etli 8C-3]